MNWCSSMYCLPLNITLRQAQGAAHQGQCDADVLALSNVPAVRRQLNKLDVEKVRRELWEFGAWDAAELADHEKNLQRLLWSACWDLVEMANERARK